MVHTPMCPSRDRLRNVCIWPQKKSELHNIPRLVNIKNCKLIVERQEKPTRGFGKLAIMLSAIYGRFV